MTKILFAADGSEASLRAARGLAGMLRWCNATDVLVLNVQPEPSLLSEVVPDSVRERVACRTRESEGLFELLNWRSRWSALVAKRY